MANRKLIVEIVGDSRSLDRAFKKSNQAADGFGRRMKHVGALAAAGIAVGVGAAVAFSVKAVKAAVSLEQSMFRVNRVFGRSADIIKKFSETTAGTLGINRDEALEFSGALGNVLRNFGIAPKAAAGMSKKLVTLAADMAVFNKATPEDTFQALQRGLGGMTRGLKKYGVILDASTAKTEALRATGKKSASDLTPLEIALARYRLILQKTQVQQGSAQKRSGTWTQIWRRIHASVHDLTEEFGTGLLPIVTRVARVLADKLANPKFREFVRKFGHEVGVTLRNALVSLSVWFQKHWPQIMAALRAGLGIVRAIARAVQLAAQNLDKLSKFAGHFGFLKSAVQGVAGGLNAGANAINRVTGTEPDKKGVTVNGNIHVHGVEDPKKLSEAIHRHAKKKPNQTRGRGKTYDGNH